MEFPKPSFRKRSVSFDLLSASDEMMMPAPRDMRQSMSFKLRSRAGGGISRPRHPFRGDAITGTRLEITRNDRRVRTSGVRVLLNGKREPCDGPPEGPAGRGGRASWRWRKSRRQRQGCTQDRQPDAHQGSWRRLARGYSRPVEPKPPDPRSVSSRLPVSTSRARETGAITSCAMRSPRRISIGASPRLMSSTPTSPR